MAAEDVPYMDKDEEAMPTFGKATYRVCLATCFDNTGRISWVFCSSSIKFIHKSSANFHNYLYSLHVL